MTIKVHDLHPAPGSTQDRIASAAAPPAAGARPPAAA